MQKLLCILITFAACFLFGEAVLWFAFTISFLLLSFGKYENSFLWEIPMGVLLSSIAVEAFSSGMVLLLRVLIPIAAVLFAGFSPRRLFAFFPLAIVALITGDGFGIAIMCGAVWCGVKSIFIADYTTKNYSLQGNNTNAENLN